MQAVKENDVENLVNRFHQLDNDGTGYLRVGVEVPSAEQVKTLQAAVAGTKKTLVEAWEEHKVENGLISPGIEGGGIEEFANQISLLDCHEFSWSRSLARGAWIATLRTAAVCATFYLFFGYLTMAYLDPSIADGSWTSIDGWYFLSATLATVGLGDYAPETQTTRTFSVIMIPFGLVILSLSVSSVQQYRLTKPYVLKKASLSTRLGDARRLFRYVDLNKSGKLTRDEAISRAPLLKVTEEEAGSLFDKININGDGVLELWKVESEEKIGWNNNTPVRCMILISKLYLVILVGTLFFKLHESEADKNNLTWIDSIYFATVVSTSIGYGDVVPVSFGGKLFLVFYMLFGTVLVGTVFAGLMEIFYKQIEARVNGKIIDSTIWVHKIAICDPTNTGEYSLVNQADYVIFKLMQMQRTDEVLVDRLIDRFIELDTSGTRSLRIGVDIPDKEQVEDLQKLTRGTSMTLQEAWDKHKMGLTSISPIVIPDPGALGFVSAGIVVPIPEKTEEDNGNAPPPENKKQGSAI